MRTTSAEQRRFFDRLALYGVPVAAGLITAWVLLGPGRERPAESMRVYGTVVAGSSRSMLRVLGTRHDENGYGVAPLDEVVVDVSAPGGDSTAHVADASRDGVVDLEVSFFRPLDTPADLEVRAGRSLLAVRVEPRARLPVHFPAGDRQRTADGEMSVVVPRGLVVPELPEVVSLSLERPAAAAPMGRLEIHADGADVRGADAQPIRACADMCRFTWNLKVTVRAPAVELEAVVDTPSGPARWSGGLPVMVGGLWVAPDARASGTLHIRSAVPRDVAYVSLLSPGGRFFGARVSMTNDEDGFAAGEVALPRTLPDGPVTALVSSEPTEPVDATAAWPLGDAFASSSPIPLGIVAGGNLERIADGMPAAIAEETARSEGVRRRAYGLVLAAGVFELLYLGLRSRRARLRLEAHLSERGGESRAAVESALPLVGLVLVSGALALAFAVLAMLSAWG